MLKVKVIAIGKCKEEWLSIALSEYEKRLSPIMDIVWIHPKDDAELIERLSQEEQYIALDPNGESMDSPSFSHKLAKYFERYRARATFAIGGPDGFPSKIKPIHRWSLSPLTFTHQIVRIILIEQIYRAMEIAKNSSYHK